MSTQTPKEKKNKTADKKEYMKAYRKAHPEKWMGKVKCEICGIMYKKCGKTDHMKSKTHKYKEMEQQLKKINEISNHV